MAAQKTSGAKFLVGNARERGVEAQEAAAIVANVGSGVSFVRTDLEGRFERVRGSSIGGGTFSGLGRCVLGRPDAPFEEVREAAGCGDASAADLTVGDVYGCRRSWAPPDLQQSRLVAASCAKAATSCSPADRCAAVLRMVCIEVANIATLLCRLHGAQQVLCTGSFVDANPQARVFIQEAFDHYTQQTTQDRPAPSSIRLRFLDKPAFVCALGALKCLEEAKKTQNSSPVAPITPETLLLEISGR